MSINVYDIDEMRKAQEKVKKMEEVQGQYIVVEDAIFKPSDFQTMYLDKVWKYNKDDKRDAWDVVIKLKDNYSFTIKEEIDTKEEARKYMIDLFNLIQEALK